MKLPIKKSQIKVIHTIKSTIRMSEEDYRSLLHSKFNRKSSTELSQFQADILINILKSFKLESISLNQKNKINKLFEDVKIEDKNKFIREKLGYNITLNQLSKNEASKLIFILEKIKRWKKEYK